jgi:hypothetical protein
MRVGLSSESEWVGHAASNSPLQRRESARISCLQSLRWSYVSILYAEVLGIMELAFRNLDRAIVDMLGDVRNQKGPPGYTDLKRIFKNFADIPTEEVKTALRDLHHRQMIRYTPDSKTVFLTDKGLSKLPGDVFGVRKRLKFKE